MSENELILWSDARHCSPWVLTVWVALREKGLSFSEKTLNLEKKEHRKGDFPRKNATGKVPALTHGNLWIGESLAILEYLEETFPSPPLLPSDAGDRATDRQILSYLRTDNLELRRCMPYEGIFIPMRTPKLSAKAKEEAKKLLELVDWRLASRGNNPLTLADFELACTLRRLIHYKQKLKPHHREFSDVIWRRPSIQSFVEQDRSRWAA